MLNLWFIFSEYVGRTDVAEAQKLRGILLDALRDPTQPRPTGERCIGAMSREYAQFLAPSIITPPYVLSQVSLAVLHV